MRWKVASVIFSAAIFSLCFGVQTARAEATGFRPVDGTYHYDIVVNGTSIGKSEVVVSSDSHVITVRERSTQEQVNAVTEARYAMPGVSLTSYFADFKLPAESQHTTLLVKPGVMTVQVPGQSVDINADPAAPLMIVGDNLVATNIMIPSILHATGAKAYTLAVLSGGKTFVAKVTSDSVTSRPAGVPGGDISVAVDVAGLREIFWYNAQSFVVADVNIAAQGLDFRLVSQGAATPMVTPPPAPTPKPTPFPHFQSHDVSFVSADGTKLAGTITVPDKAARSFAAIVLVHGTGALDRNETIGPNPVFLQLSNALSNAGYVVLRYDKRGVALSGGRRDSPRRTLLADVTAAYEFVRKRPRVDAHRVFLLGHSEGGELVPTVAAEHSDVAGIILMAPPALPLWQISMRQRLEGLSGQQAQQAKVQELAALAAIRDGSDRSPGMSWYRSSMEIDPAVDIKRVACPILILQGADDVQVFANDLPRLVKAAKSAGLEVIQYVFPNDNHLFMKVSANEPRTPAAAVHQYLTLPSQIDPKVMLATLKWLRTKSAAR